MVHGFKMYINWKESIPHNARIHFHAIILLAPALKTHMCVCCLCCCCTSVPSTSTKSSVYRKRNSNEAKFIECLFCFVLFRFVIYLVCVFWSGVLCFLLLVNWQFGSDETSSHFTWPYFVFVPATSSHISLLSRFDIYELVCVSSSSSPSDVIFCSNVAVIFFAAAAAININWLKRNTVIAYSCAQVGLRKRNSDSNDDDDHKSYLQQKRSVSLAGCH